ncbi:DUF2332 family protein [Microbacterium lacusdiani]
MRLDGDVPAMYAEFADYADGSSPSFARWARRVAADADVVAWLESLPPVKRQPNLVFAAARRHGVPAPGPYEGLRRALLADDGSIRATILSHATQTNEAGRMATLVPAFAAVAGDRPLALIEVGPSAGLCLVPDRWGYAWRTPAGEKRIPPPDGGGVLSCDVTGSAPLPDRVPTVAWRTGLDLNPLDVRDDEQMAWLETLVWPEEDDRRAQLRTAIRLTRVDPPPLVRGDLLVDLDDLIDRAGAEAPDAVVVVFHTVVAMYLSADDRAAFADAMRARVAAGRCHWVSSEVPGVVPGVAGEGVTAGRLVLAIDGAPAAAAHQHGRTLDWFR